jgi:hypothetical protein
MRNYTSKYTGKLNAWLPKDEAETLKSMLHEFYPHVIDPKERGEMVHELVMNRVHESIGVSMSPNADDPKLVKKIKRDIRKQKGLFMIEAGVEQESYHSDVIVSLAIYEEVTQ